MSSESEPSTNGASSTTDSTHVTQSPSQDSAMVAEQTQPSQQDGSSKTTSKDKQKQKKTDPPASNAAETQSEAGAGAKLTPAQLKKQKQLEKQQRRAEKVVAKGEQVQKEQVPKAQQQGGPTLQRRPSQGASSSNTRQRDGSQISGQSSHHNRRPSGQQGEFGTVRLPLRSAGGAAAAAGTQPPSTQSQAPQKMDKRVPFASHLYPPAKTMQPGSLAAAPREIHPSVLTLALHFRSLTICGSNARTTALLLVLKRVINSYTTPPNTALSRHLTTQISHQISWLSSARPLSIAQGNAIRWLKKLISQLDLDLEESDAKRFLCTAIDSFIREKLTLAAEVISTQASSRIEATGETILVYGKSSSVERVLLHAAKEEGKQFRVVVVDSRPLFEGKNLARGLLRAGMREGGELPGCSVVYTLISGLAEVLEQETITKCILGASGMLGNGALYSRCGTAMVAMMAKEAKVPVIVVSETLKFTAKMAVDSLNMNEIGSEDALLETDVPNILTTAVPAETKDNAAGKKGGGGGGGKKKGNDDKDAAGADDDDGSNSSSPLKDWQDTPNLFLLNLMYDVTPAEYIDMVICELGTLPPGAVPVVNGVHGGDE